MIKIPRPNKYFTNIKCNFEQIKEMLQDMNEVDVARFFGVTKQSWITYKKTYKEFNDLIKNVRTKTVTQCRKNLRQIADGYRYDKVKEYIRDENGKIIKEIEHVCVPPSERANSLLLNNLDPNWSENPKELKIKQEELKIKQESIF